MHASLVTHHLAPQSEVYMRWGFRTLKLRTEPSALSALGDITRMLLGQDGSKRTVTGLVVPCMTGVNFEEFNKAFQHIIKTFCTHPDFCYLWIYNALHLPANLLSMLPNSMDLVVNRVCLSHIHARDYLVPIAKLSGLCSLSLSFLSQASAHTTLLDLSCLSILHLAVAKERLVDVLSCLLIRDLHSLSITMDSSSVLPGHVNIPGGDMTKENCARRPAEDVAVSLFSRRPSLVSPFPSLLPALCPDECPY
jgi:hypothetical protein